MHYWHCLLAKGSRSRSTFDVDGVFEAERGLGGAKDRRGSDRARLQTRYLLWRGLRPRPNRGLRRSSPPNPGEVHAIQRAQNPHQMPIAFAHERQGPTDEALHGVDGRLDCCPRPRERSLLLLSVQGVGVRSRSQWSQPDSNRRHRACKARALPTELWPRQPDCRADSATRRARSSAESGRSDRL